MLEDTGKLSESLCKLWLEINNMTEEGYNEIIEYQRSIGLIK